uniref:GTD-binding domain-containing protein n=1 Tax=Leersia perrieri TaxID=77586 RepID=A0A0D9X637_9ORYZ
MAGVGEEENGEVAAAALREALRRQEAAVEELRAELEVERQAAASGADEALTMIVRLQAEKAAERMEAEQFRRVAEERISHDEDTLAFLKAVVFHQEMEISSLNRRLLAAAAVEVDAIDIPWLRKLAKNGVLSTRNASLPAARLEELCSEIDAAGDNNGGGRRAAPARTVSDIGEVIGREKDWLTSNANASHRQPPPPASTKTRLLHRSASHRLRRAPSYSESFAAMRSTRRASTEIISEEEENLISQRKECNCNEHTTIAELGADIGQIKLNVQNLQTELITMKEEIMIKGDSQARLLAEICAKLDAIQMHQGVQVENKRSSAPPVQVRVSREEGSSSKGGNYTQSELLMNHFIEVSAVIFSSLLVRPLLKVAASMSLFRCFLILVLAVVFRKVLMN